MAKMFVFHYTHPTILTIYINVRLYIFLVWSKIFMQHIWAIFIKNTHIRERSAIETYKIILLTQYHF